MTFRKILVVIGLVGGLVFASSQLIHLPMPGLWSLLDDVGGWLPPSNALVSVHAIWFSTIVPVFVSSVWIGTKLRTPRVWTGLFLAVTLGAAIWLVSDIYVFLRAGAAMADAPRRLLYVLISETGKPVLPLMLGTLLASLFSRRLLSHTASQAAASA